MGRIDVTTFKAADKLPLVMVLDNVRSLHNVGSVLRTADAFRIAGVCLCGITGAPDGRPAIDPTKASADSPQGRPNPNIAEIHKTALGAEDSVDWHYYATTMEAVHHLRAEGYTIVAIEQCKGSIMLNEWRGWEPSPTSSLLPSPSSLNSPTSSLLPPLSSLNKFAFIMGNEVKGVAQDVVDASDLVIEIPQYGTKHSLNVSVTAGIVMWEALRQWLEARHALDS